MGWKRGQSLKQRKSVMSKFQENWCGVIVCGVGWCLWQEPFRDWWHELEVERT